MTVPRYIPKFEPPTEDQLKDMALKFVQANKPKEYQRMLKARELDEYLHLKAKQARDHAENLIMSGEWDKQAWATAERLIILEATSD